MVKINDKVVLSFYANGEYWSDGKVPHAGADYAVTNAFDLRTCYSNIWVNGISSSTNVVVFAGDSLTFGQPGSAVTPRLCGWGPGWNNHKINYRAWQCDDFQVYSGEFFCNNTGWIKQYGTMTFHSGKGHFHFYGTGYADDQQRGYILAGRLVADPDVEVHLYCSAKDNTGNRTSRMYLEGDFSGFQGRFRSYYSSTTVILNGPQVCSGATAAKPDALVVERNCAVTIYPSCVQNPNFGITILPTDGGGNFYLETDAESGDYDLLLPVTAEDASMTMTTRNNGADSGAITLKNDMTAFAGTVVVASGTLILSDEATLPDGLRFVVKPGARLLIRRTAGSKDLDITVEPGGMACQSLLIPYDGTATTAQDCTELTAADYANWNKPICLELTQTVPFPVNATQELVCARFPAGVAGVHDFTNATPLTAFGLPHTWFKLVPDGTTGQDELVLVVKPVIDRTGKDVYRPFEARTTYSRATGAYTDVPVWSDGLVVHGGADYVHTNGCEFWSFNAGDNQTRVFPGDSLYLTSAYSSKSAASIFPPLTLAGTASFSVVAGSPSLHHFGGGPYTLLGNAAAYGNAEYGKMFCYSIDAELRDSAGYTFTLSGGSNATHVSYLTGTNGQYLGKFKVTNAKTPTDSSNSTIIAISHAKSLGGPLPSFTWDALSLGKHSLIRPLETMTLDAANRGISVEAPGGGFDVPDGVTLTILQTLRNNASTQATPIYKEGSGTLALGGDVVHGWDGTNRVEGVNDFLLVHAGTVASVGKKGWNTLRLIFSEGAGIRVDPAATGDVGTYGLYLPQALAPAEDGGTIAVTLPADYEAGSSAVFSATVCTVAGDWPDLTATFRPQKVARMTAQVVRDDATFAAEGLVRYAVKWMRGGLVVVFR
ncbi:MAG: hypothetical protein ACI4Q3_09810 [Kiritimatiellia bacterium]